MRIIVTVVTVDDFERNTSGVWKRGKILVLQNQSLRSDFITRFSQKAKEIRTVDPTFATIEIATMSKVCQDVLRKMCHARFGAVEQVYKIQKALKHGGDITFRGGLLATTMRGGTREERSGLNCSC